MIIALERTYYPLIINMLNLQEHLVIVGSSGFHCRCFTDLLQVREHFACRKQAPQNSITLRAPNYDMSVNAALYPLIPLKSCFTSHLPLFILLEKKYKI